MKLRTEVVSFQASSVLTSPTMDDDVNRIALRHDAAAAHALMMAMDDANEAAGFDVSWWIKTRADSLLKQWGFDTGEDA